MSSRSTATLATLLVAAAVSADATELADPMRPALGLAAPVAEQPVEKINGWRLSSTLVASGRRVAVVNGRVVGVGDRIDGARVVAIQAREVLLTNDGSRITLRLVGDKNENNGQGRAP